MPVAAHPRRREYYLYWFKVDSYPFYVGVGRAKRGPDRLRYVRSLLTPHNRAKLGRKSLCVRVLAELVQRHERIEYSQTRRRFTRTRALKLEKRLIDKLIRGGYLLTNWQYNPFRHRDADIAVKAIVTGRRVL
jgi:hypothetical protein